jgi:hypothetical protein
MAKPRTKQEYGPFSVRLPVEMRQQIEALAEQEMRTLHSMVLVLLRDALEGRLQAEAGSSSAESGGPSRPTE